MKMTVLNNTSILRKFTILFILMSILPMGVLYYFYVQICDHGRLEITSDNFNITLFLIVLGITVGYFSMRSVIKELMKSARESTQTLQEVLGQDTFVQPESEQNEISVLTHSFNIATQRLIENIRNLELAQKTLHSVLSKVGTGISSMKNIDTFLDLIIETITESLGSNKGALLLCDEEKGDLYVKTVYGAKLDTKREFRIKFAGGIFDNVQKERNPIVISDIKDSGMPSDGIEVFFEQPLLCAPLKMHDSILGIIVISRKKNGKQFDKDEFSLLNNIALQTAVAVENSRLNDDAERTYFETISALALAVEAKDVYSRGHLDRVSDYSTKIAKKLNLSQDDITILRDAARLHDIGKIGIYDDVLKKPGKLTPEEREMIIKHPKIGESIIKPIHSLRPLCDVMRHHHEFLDGSGYPDGLKGDEISLLTRILTVSDIYDALTTNRPYRDASTPQEAHKILESMNKQIDIKIVKTLFDII